MEKEKLKISVVDIATKQILFECPISESDKAYQLAAEMEELGADVEVMSPTLNESLSASLGLSEDSQRAYLESVKAEEHLHEGSCCFEDDSEKKVVH
jgi:hypothetical protein